MDAAEGLSDEEKAEYEAALKEQDEAVDRWMEQWKTRPCSSGVPKGTRASTTSW